MPEWLAKIGDKVFTEAGILAFVLFWLSVYLIIDNRSLRKSKDKELKEQNDKLYYMGTKNIEQNVLTNLLLDKMGDAVEKLTHLLERAGILEKADDAKIEKANRPE